jgi:hypothetical protein
MGKYRNIGQAQRAELDFVSKVGQDPVQLIIENQVEAIIFKFANDIVNDLKLSIEEKEINASGNLLSSIKPTTSQSGSNLFKLEIKMADYWEDVENGQKKGTIVPIEDLMSWITNKPIKVRTSRRQSGASVLQARKSLAVMIQRAIVKNGTIKRFGYKGSKFLTSVVNDEAVRDLSNSISQEIGRTVAITVATLFNPKYIK